MLAQRFIPSAVGRQRKEAGAFGARQQRVMRGLQNAVAGKADDGAVDLLVDFEIIAQFAALTMTFDSRLKRLETVDILFRHTNRGEFRRASFDGADGLE